MKIEVEGNGPMIHHWKAIYDEYRPLLKPNKKTADEVLGYLREKYPMVLENLAEAKEVARLNIAEGLSHSGTMEEQDPSSFQLVVFKVEDKGSGADLYRTQQQDFVDSMVGWRQIHPDAQDIPAEEFPFPILINVEMNSGYLYVDGSPRLNDEVEIYQGHNEKELKNLYIVAHYVGLLQKAGQI